MRHFTTCRYRVCQFSIRDSGVIFYTLLQHIRWHFWFHLLLISSHELVALHSRHLKFGLNLSLKLNQLLINIVFVVQIVITFFTIETFALELLNIDCSDGLWILNMFNLWVLLDIWLGRAYVVMRSTRQSLTLATSLGHCVHVSLDSSFPFVTYCRHICQ